MREQLRALARSPKLPYLALAMAGLLYHVLFLRTFSHWWFEDDPSLFAFVRTIANPLRFFFDREVIGQFGRAFVPMQALSMWCDDALVYRSVRFAQAHHIISLEAALLLLFAVLRNFGLKPGASFALATIWLFFPAVVAVNEFLSTRHYLEGFAWSLGALLIAQKIKRSSAPPDSRTQILLWALLLAATFSKEIFAVTVPLAIAFYIYERRSRAVLLSLLAIPPFYILCRFLAVGRDTFYGAPFLGVADYMQFLRRIPYIVAGNFGGYILVLVTVALLFLLRVRRQIRSRAVFCMILCLITVLGVIYPVSFPLSRDWLLHGTWYRAAFLLASGLLLSFGYALSKLRSSAARNALLVVAAVIVFCGGRVTQRKWQVALMRYRDEGHYYLAHPERLLYSELPAYWFLPGLDDMYALKSHHVTAAQRRLPADVESYETIWRYHEGRFVEDPNLLASLAVSAPNE